MIKLQIINQYRRYREDGIEKYEIQNYAYHRKREARGAAARRGVRPATQAYYVTPPARPRPTPLLLTDLSTATQPLATELTGAT